MVNGEQLWKLLKGVADGSVTPREALGSVLSELQTGASANAASTASSSFKETPEVVVDLDRAARCGFPEVVYGPGKSLEAIASVLRAQAATGQNSLVTRCSEEQLHGLQSQFADAIVNPLAKTARVMRGSESRGRVVVATAGSSDRPVAEEACETLAWMGVDVELVMDVGVAGPQRFLDRRHLFTGSDAVVVVAGMEGALPSVIGGWIDVPIIGVPTSVGYGASFGGVSALLSMLNSCASNVTVVNIDGGFKGGYVAGMIARRSQRANSSIT